MAQHRSSQAGRSDPSLRRGSTPYRLEPVRPSPAPDPGPEPGQRIPARHSAALGVSRRHATARRVLPMPGGPVSVTAAVCACASIWDRAASSPSRPTNGTAGGDRPHWRDARPRVSHPTAPPMSSIRAARRPYPSIRRPTAPPPSLAQRGLGLPARIAHVGGFPDTAMTACARTTVS